MTVNFFQDFFFFFAIGVSVGLVGYLFGLGGGILLVPILSSTGLNMHQSIATSLTIIVFNSTAVSIEKLKNHEINLSFSGALELAGVIGAVLGGFVAQALPAVTLKKLFSFFTIWMAVTVASGRDRRLSEDGVVDVGKNCSVDGTLPAWPFLLGLFGGGVSAILGIGSGALMVPMLTFLGDMPFKVAAGTSSYVSGIFALVGAAVLFEHIQYEIVPVLLLSVRIGTGAANKWLDKVESLTLRRIFALLLCLISYRMWG